MNEYFDIINHNIEQIKGFYMDIVELNDEVGGSEFVDDFEELRDNCERLRWEFSVVYSKLLDKKN